MKNYLKDIQADDSQSLRAFLKSLNDDELIGFETVREDFLLSGIVEELENVGKFPVVIMRDPHRELLTAANIFASRDRLKRSIHNITCVEQAAENFKKYTTVEAAPVQQEVELDVNVDSLPVFRHFEKDAGRYISSGIVVAKDPERGRYNLSFHRMQMKDGNRIGISLHSRGDLWNYFHKAKEVGNDLEIAVVIGAHPAFYITAASKIPETQDDYWWAAAYMNEELRLVQAQTVDLLVPAEAEMVLEGRISISDFEKEGPFGEYTGYSTSRSTDNLFYVSAMTRRKDAIYQDLVPGFAWEHLLLSQFTKEIILLDKLKKEIPQVKDLCMPKNGCHFHAYVSMEPKAPGQVKQMMMLLFGLDLYLKLIVVVNPDVDIHNEEEVIWAMATRMQADEDVFIVPKVMCNRLDPSSRDGMAAKMGIDATVLTDQWEADRVKVPEDVLQKAAAMIKEKMV